MSKQYKTNGSAPDENVWRQMLQENCDRQEAGFERCYEAFGVTDDRERSWSALVIALKDATRDAATSDGPVIGYVNTKWAEHRKGTTTIYPELHPRLATFPVFAAIESQRSGDRK